MYNGKSFQELFKRYRLRSEFATFSELGLALAEKGLIYEESIFSHWQKGTRVPQRATIIKLLEIFSERQSIKSIQDANEFLESAGEGYLTEPEAKRVKFKAIGYSPFQVPSQIDNFTGREVLITDIKKDIYGNILLIHGVAGVGKSTLAIRLGHLLKDKFPDGVLWFRLDTSDVSDILLSIAFAFGVNIGHIQDREIRATMVRSILSNRKVLLIFDNVEAKNNLGLLLPNNKNCFVIITSKVTNLSISGHHTSIFLDIFTKEEVLFLYKSILGSKYVVKNKSHILKLAGKVGFLPLALHIFSKELKKGSITITELLEQIKEDSLSLQELSYGDKNLYLAINFSFELLDEETKKVFLSLAVFEGKDFSEEAVSYINGLSIVHVKKLLNNLQNISLIEESTKIRHRIHPMIRKFLREKFDDQTMFIKAAKFYRQFLARFDKKLLKSYPNLKQESINVLYIFRKCYQLHYWDEVITLWNPLETLLDATHQLKKMRYVYQVVKAQKTGINIFQKILIVLSLLLFLSWVAINMAGLKTSVWNYIWNFSVCLINLPGAVVGFYIAKSWGLFKSSLGKAILFLSVGLFTWGMGNLIWAYYNFFLNVAIPYPSYADLGFILSYPFWVIGIISLPHAIGARPSFSKKYRKMLLFIPLFVFALSYFLMVYITKSFIIFAHPSSYLKLFFDIAYPIGDVVILTTTLAIGTSFRFFGGKYKLSMYAILLGFCILYIADFLFSYTTSANIYYDGSIADLFFDISMSLLTFGVLGFYLQKD